MVYQKTPLHHHLFKVAVTEGVAQVPPDTQQYDVRLEMTPLEGVLWVHGCSGEWQAILSTNTTPPSLPLVFATLPFAIAFVISAEVPSLKGKLSGRQR